MARRKTLMRGAGLEERISRFVPPLLRWFFAAARDMPWRRTRDPYAIWISEIMLQQTQVKTVIPYWVRWMQTLPDPQALARAPQDRVLKLWEGLGYYTRARNLQKAAQCIVERHGGRFPTHYEDVLALPGIGRYTAGAICSIAYNQPTPILDGNVIRVLARLFGLAGDPRGKETNEKLWGLAAAAVRFAATLSPTEAHSDRTPWLADVAGPCSAVNQALMELGALVCTPKQPRCPECPLKSSCRALASNRVDLLPMLPARASATERNFVAFALLHRGRWLVRQRPAGSVNAHLWEFPAFELDGPVQAVDPRKLLRREFRLTTKAQTPTLASLPIVRHSITRYRITVTPFLARVPDHLQPPWPHDLRSQEQPGAEVGWKTRDEIDALAMTSAHRRLWKSLPKTMAPPMVGSQSQIDQRPAPRRRARIRTNLTVATP